MSSLVVIYCLLFLLCFHICSARHLRVSDEEIHAKSHVFGKGLVQDKQRGKHQKSVSPSSASPYYISEEKEDTEGNETKTPSPQEVLQEATKIEEWKRQARRMLGTKSHDAEETVNSKENDGVMEDIVVMDYAQPHRKPPIHNREP